MTGGPLGGIRILALEQMQALPFATQLMGWFGAEVIKIEHPTMGESGRASTPAMPDPWGRPVGATFLRNNLNKRSVGIDLKDPRGVALVRRLAGSADVVAENFRPGVLTRLGLSLDSLRDHDPALITCSVSGFGSDPASPYRDWAAYASIVEAMSGIYMFSKRPDEPPRANPVGALGDISSALFAVVGIFAALRERDVTGLGQHVDIAMLDAMISMSDVVPAFHSLGVRRDEGHPLEVLLDTFAADDGWFVLQVGREHQFAKLAELVGHPEWLTDPRFASRTGWVEHCEEAIRPAIESWASGMTRAQACDQLSAAGVVAGPVFKAADVVSDPHVAAHDMLISTPRTDGGEPLLQPGNPVKLSRAEPGQQRRFPWVGEHTDEVLRDLGGLTEADVEELRAGGVISPSLPPFVEEGADPDGDRG
ncbi:MAG: CoA transferase [Acidimicrobiia bacterium]|jgi:crotonobetainyl-CoA:carnitine CoA-transferase CaiB-like acyl-CoA transferase|nr:CoA transferase [Acidimicrobiia bacterium]MBP8180339.1 CoA transferase [Acidimicrobiia bacterium]